MTVQVKKCLANLLRHRSGHFLSQRVEIVQLQELLKVTISHELHNDAREVLEDEFLFEAHNVGAVFAASLQLDFPVNMGTLLSIVGNLLRLYRLDRKQLARAPVLSQHHCAVRTLSELL